MSWLHACGYLYRATTHGFPYLCTCENKIRIERIATSSWVKSGRHIRKAKRTESQVPGPFCCRVGNSRDGMN